MNATCTNNDLTPVDIAELELVSELLSVVSPSEGGPQPGAQLSRARSGRIWTITDGTTTVDVRRSGSIGGLQEPVWMTARSLLFAARGCSNGHDRCCSLAIDDRREADGTVAALIHSPFTRARIDLPAQPPVPPLHPPAPASVIATATTDMVALLRAVEAASLAPVGVPVSGSPTGTFEVAHNALLISGTDRRGVDRPAEFRLDAATECHVSPAITVQLHVELATLVELSDELPLGEVIVTLTTDGELWLIAGPCRVLLRGELRRLEPDEVDGVVYLVGRVEGTDEPVLSLDSDCPIDGTVVWLESEPDDYGPLELIEQHHPIVWYAEPEPYGVGAGDG